MNLVPKTLTMKLVTYAPLIGALCTVVYGGITTWFDVHNAKQEQEKLKHFITEYDKDLDKIYSQFNLLQRELGRIDNRFTIIEKEEQLLEYNVQTVEKKADDNNKNITIVKKQIPELQRKNWSQLNRDYSNQSKK